MPAAAAKKADGASTVTLQIPRPPSFTGRVACVHWLSFTLILMTSVIWISAAACQIPEVEDCYRTLMFEEYRGALER